MSPKHAQIIEKLSRWVVDQLGIQGVIKLGEAEGPEIEKIEDYLYGHFYGVDEEFTRRINHMVPPRVTSRMKRQEARVDALCKALHLAIEQHRPVSIASTEDTAGAVLAEKSLVSV